MFTAELLPEVLDFLEHLPKWEGRSDVEEALNQLALEPDSPQYWECGEDTSGRYILAGPHMKWQISYEIDRSAGLVRIHDISERPSKVFDPFY